MRRLTRREVLAAGAAGPLASLAAGCESANPQQSGTAPSGSAPPAGAQTTTAQVEFYGLTLLRTDTSAGRVTAARVLAMNSDGKFTITGQKQVVLEEHVPFLVVHDGKVSDPTVGSNTSLGFLIDLTNASTLELGGVAETGLSLVDASSASDPWEPLSWVPSLRWLDKTSPATAVSELTAKEVRLSVQLPLAGRILALPPKSVEAFGSRWTMAHFPGAARAITDRFAWRAPVSASGLTISITTQGAEKRVTISPIGSRDVRLELVYMPFVTFHDPDGSMITHAAAYHLALAPKPADAVYEVPVRASLPRAAVQRTGGGDPICMACWLNVEA